MLGTISISGEALLPIHPQIQLSTRPCSPLVGFPVLELRSPKHPLEGGGWQSSHAPKPMLTQLGIAPSACGSTCLSTAHLLATEELAQQVLELLRGHLQMAMSGVLTIVDTAPAFQ